MGVDGEQILHIRGPKDSIDAMDNGDLLFPTDDDNLQKIACYFFGKQILKKQRLGENYLVVTYIYRNRPVYEYLAALMALHKKCWMKSEFTTDQGLAGVWLARYRNDMLWIQEYAWTEPSSEELVFSTDFSFTV